MKKLILLAIVVCLTGAAAIFAGNYSGNLTGSGIVCCEDDPNAPLAE